jgi:DHA2 family multidrug resistance protein
VDGRYVIAVGFVMFAAGLWMFSGVTADWGFAELFWPQVVRGLAILLCIVPAVGMAMNGNAPSDLRYASGLFNLMRNLGGAIGIAVVNTWLQDTTRLHALRLSEGLAETPAKAAAVLQGLTQYAGQFTPDAGRALLMAQAQMGRIVGRQAATLGFADTYRLMAWMFIAALVVVPFCKPAPQGVPPPPDAH